MKNLITRSITGILFVAVILGAIWYSQVSFRGLILITTILCLLEFYRLVNENVSRWILYGDILGGTYLVGVLFLIPNMQSGLPAIYTFIPYLIYLLYSFIIRLYLKEENPIASWGHSFLGQVYIALPLGLLSFIAYPPLATEYLLMPYNALLVIAFFSFIWINDTGAYIVGCTIGKHRLFERISPKKSWEGFFRRTCFLLTLRMGMVDTMFFPQYGTVDRIECRRIDFLDMGRPLRIATETDTECQRFRQHITGTRRIARPPRQRISRISGNCHLPLSTLLTAGIIL